MTDCEWLLSVVCLCVCVCVFVCALLGGGWVCPGRPVRSGIPQRNHLLGLSMLQQLITVTVSVCVCVCVCVGAEGEVSP